MIEGDPGVVEPIVPRIDKEPNVAKRGHVWMGMVKR